ncbi:MAG: lipopolysaccharide biosynthesis protein [Candidatus Solibacter sp.]|nr:lipopolysaccharide biosynthesis protein [Candidatus Solibacter sp.]
MRTGRGGQASPRPATSLRSSFAWTLAGNGIYAAAQWAILSLVAKLGGSEMLGQYALAVALTTPLVMLAHLNLRAVLATDVDGRQPFGDYVAVRLGVSGLGLAGIAILALLSGDSGSLAAVILVTGLAQSSETVSDIYYGAMQRRDEMELIARSMIARGLVSVCAFGVALYLLRDLVWALAAVAAGRLALLLAYDRPRGAAGESLARSGLGAEVAILRTAMPLGVMLLLVSLNTNLPRYVIERFLGVRELGIFAAVVAFMTVGSTAVNALGQATTPRLARHFSRRESKHFLRLTFTLAASVGALGVAGVMVAAVFGETILGLLYRPEYAAYGGLLVAVMGAAIPGYVAIALGYAITATRAFDAQVPLFCVVAASCGGASWLLVPRFGLRGAALSLAIAASLQIGGEGWILARAMHRIEPAA